MDTELTNIIPPGTRVVITKPKLTKALYELCAENKPIGSISFPKTFGTLAETSIGQEAWTFKRMGFWKPFITVRKKNENGNLYEIPFSGRGHGLIGLTGRSGATYELIQKGFWNPRWVWIKYQQPVIEYQMKHGLKKFAEVTLHDCDEMTPLLLLLGSYGLIMLSQDDGAAAASVAAIG